MTIKKS